MQSCVKILSPLIILIISKQCSVVLGRLSLAINMQLYRYHGEKEAELRVEVDDVSVSEDEL